MGGWYVGAIINLVGSIAINLGTNVMKLGHNKRAEMTVPEADKPSVKRIREWQIGVAMFAVGNVANFVSFGYAAQSLLAALGCIQFVSNVGFAYWVLKEKVTMLVVVATGLIVGGCILLVLFGNHESNPYTVHDLMNLYAQVPYILYLVWAVITVVGMYLLYCHGVRKLQQTLAQKPAAVWSMILPVAYALYSGLIGTQSVLLSKSLSVLLRETFSGNNQLGEWFTWVVLPLFIATAAFWVTRLNKGLRMFPAMVIVPTMQISWTLFSIISGMLYFEEYKGFSSLSAIMFAVGVLIVFSGVYLLTKSQGTAKKATPVKVQAVSCSPLSPALPGAGTGALPPITPSRVMERGRQSSAISINDAEFQSIEVGEETKKVDALPPLPQHSREVAVGINAFQPAEKHSL